MSVRSLGITCCAAEKENLPRTCVLCVGGCRAFLLFKWWLVLWLCWLIFPPLGQLLKQLSNAVLGGIFSSKLIEDTSSLLFCSLFPEDNQGSSLQPVEEARRKFPSPKKLGASGGFQPQCSAGGRDLQVRTAALLGTLGIRAGGAVLGQECTSA